MAPSTQEAFALLYAIFWAAMLTSVGRYRLFSTHRFLEDFRPWLRFLVSFATVNVLPLALFVWLIGVLGRDGPAGPNYWAAGFDALGVFAFNRIAFGLVIARGGTIFYTPDEWKALTCRREDANLEPPISGWSHVLGAFMYLGVLGIGLVMRHM